VPADYESLVRSGRLVLGDCAVGTRLQYESPLRVDDDLGLIGLVDEPLGASAIRSVIAGYTATAAQLGLPIVVDAPTWWARRDRLARAGITGAAARRAVRGCADLLQGIRDAYPDVFVCAPIGPSTDGYRPGEVNETEAEAFHHWQVDALAESGVDVVLAATFSTTLDLAVAAKVLAGSGLTYALGPTIDDGGCLPDGRSLGHAIDMIESSLDRPPVHWAICCVHPKIADGGLDRLAATNPAAHARVVQLKGNGSRATSEERDAAGRVLADEPEAWAEAAFALHDRHAIRLIGGCCGTDHRHFLSLAIRIAGGTA
jgi:homocysteine S-methyltransferase